MIRATKPWNAKILIALMAIIILAMPAIAANNPGHDSLYIEQSGDSVLTGNLNVSYLLTLEGNAYLKSYLDLIANGTVVGSSPSRNTIYATNTLLEIDAVSGGNIYLDRYGGTVLTGSPSARTDLNVSGNLYLYNPTGYTTLTVGNVAVCLANGTGCPTIQGGNAGGAGGGWTNTTTTTSTSLDVNIDTGTLFVNSTSNKIGISTTNPATNLDIQGNTTINQTLYVDTIQITGACCGTAINFNNENMIGLNTITISDSGAGEGIQWADSTWSIDNSPLDRSNTVGNLNLYSTQYNISLWRPTLFIFNSGNYTTLIPQSGGGLDFITTGSGTGGHITFNPTNNVGIKTTSPTSTLQVIGTTNTTYLTIASATAASCDLKAFTNGTVYCGTDATGSGGDGTGGWTNTTTTTSTSLNVSVDSGTLFVDSSNNRVGIGITEIGKTFEVAGEILARQTSTQAGGTAGTLSPDSFGVNIWVNSRYNSSDPTTGWARAITIQNSTGNIGLGTSQPGAKLDVASTSSTAAFFNSTASETKVEIHNVAADGDPKIVWELPGTRAWQAGIDDSDSDKWKIGYAENTDWSSTAITIDTSGNVGIGDTTPSYTTEIQNLFTPIQLKVTGPNSTGGIQLGTYMTIQGSIDVDNGYHRGLLGEGVFYDAITDTYNLTNAQYDRSAIEFLNSGHIGIFTESQDRSASPNLTSSAWANLERMRITNTGLVGIATKSPTSTLQVNGQTNTTYLTIASATAASCDLKAYTNGTVYCGTDADTNSGGTVTGTGTGAYIAQWQSASVLNNSVIYQNGTNIGINITTPAEVLHVNGKIRADTSFVLNGATALSVSSANTLGIAQSSGWSNGVVIYTNGTEKVKIDVNGSVGIGTSNPTYKLDVNGSINLPTGSYYRSEGIALIGLETGTVAIGTTQNYNVTIYAGSATPRLKINANGNGSIGIGTNNPQGQLHIYNATNLRDGWHSALEIQSTGMSNYPSIFFSGQNTSGYSSITWTNSTSGGNTSMITGSIYVFPSNSTNANMYFATNGAIGSAGYTNKMVILGNGRVGIGTVNPSETLEVVGNITATAYFYTSDEKLKDNITELTGLAIVNKLRGVSFNWKEGGDPSIGVVAQEVEAVLPQVVATNEETGMKSVNYGALVGPLIESTKELDARNTEQDKTIEQLTLEIEKMKKELQELKSKEK
jgi:hypothetical protein